MIEIAAIEGLEKCVEVIENVQKQATYATSLALNATAKQIQTTEYELSNSVFHIRKNWNKPNTKFGIDRTYAKKDNLNVIIYSKAQWLKDQEYGGTETLDRGKYTPIFVPNKELQQTKGRIMPKQISIGTILANKIKAKAFLINGNWWYRKDKKTIVPLFFKESSVTIHARYPFSETGIAIYDKNFKDEFDKAFKYALDTAR